MTNFEQLFIKFRMKCWAPLFFLGVTLQRSIAHTHERRNVLLMISDDLRPELSVYNQTQSRTPQLV